MEVQSLYIERLRAIYSHTISFGLTSTKNLKRVKDEVWGHKLWERVPSAIRQHVLGYEHALRDELWGKGHFLFMCLWEGKAYDWDDAPKECREYIMSHNSTDLRDHQAHVWKKFLPEIRRFT
jgi:hypothetical protein